MPKSFSIDFIRQAFEQKLLEEHIKNKEYFGGKSQVNVFSFYEQLKSQEQVDRFVETYRDLSEQQNRAGLILNGVIVAPENPTITNLYSCDIIPMSWTCSFRCTLANRDQACVTIDNLIKQLKGRKVDIAELCCRDNKNHKVYTPFMVGTIGQYDEEPKLKNGDYIGDYNNIEDELNNLFEKNMFNISQTYLLYVKDNNELKVVDFYSWDLLDNGASYIDNPEGSISGDKISFTLKYHSFQDFNEMPILFDKIDCIVNFDKNGENIAYNVRGYIKNSEDVYLDGDNNLIANITIEFDRDFLTRNGYTMKTSAKADIYRMQYMIIEDDGTYPDFIFPPENESFEKYKLSFSFDAIRCDEPRNLNAEEYCEISFSGSATLVNESVQLGNDLIKISISKLGINAATPIDFTTDPDNPTWWLEPLEMPSGSNANTNPIQLMSNRFIANSHTDALALTLQYTFIYDKHVQLLKQLFKYARYGTQGLTKNDISPNMIFGIKEIWSSWGEYEEETFKAKIVENVDIENTESDTLTLSLTMQLQGDND